MKILGIGVHFELINVLTVLQETLEESQDSGCGSGNDTQVGIYPLTARYVGRNKPLN